MYDEELEIVVDDPRFALAEEDRAKEVERIRGGSYALSVFARSLNAQILRAHADGPLCAGELEERMGWAPQTSLRTSCSNLCEVAALDRVESVAGSRGAATELTPAGRDLLTVADALDHWLSSSPLGPLPLEGGAARGTIKVLTAGWDSTIVMELAERPLTLTELSDAIDGVNYPAMKRRLSKLRSNSLVAPEGKGKGTTYLATDWLRRSIGPLMVGGRWERRHRVAGEPVSRVDVEAAFMLMLPLVELSSEASGTCALAVLGAKEGAGRPSEVGGVAVEVEGGRIVACSPSTALAPTSWALGNLDEWFEAVIDGRYNALRIKGDEPRLPQRIVKALHAVLFSDA